jgi:hypothetical protein
VGLRGEIFQLRENIGQDLRKSPLTVGAIYPSAVEASGSERYITGWDGTYLQDDSDLASLLGKR